MEYLSYYELLNDVVYSGHNYAHTHLLNDVTYRIDCEGVARAIDSDDDAIFGNVPNSNVVIVPAMRGHLPFNNSYALTELVWYLIGSRNASEIQEHAPLWGRIAQNGKVNSNYGYQLRVNNAVPGGFDAAFKEAARKLTAGKRLQASLDIVSQSNMQDDFDTVCNNRVDVIIESDGRMHLRVVARSIDMIFGLPYDQFNAQVLGHYIARKINLMSLKENKSWDHAPHAYLSSVTFDIANVHVYNDNLNNMAIKNFEQDNRFGDYRLFNYDDIRQFVEKMLDDSRDRRLDVTETITSVNYDVKAHVFSSKIAAKSTHLASACNGVIFKHSDAHDTFDVLTKTHEFKRYTDIELMSHNTHRLYDSRIKFHDMLKQRDPYVTGYGDRKRLFLTNAGEVVHVSYDHGAGQWFTKTYESLGSLKAMRAREADD